MPATATDADKKIIIMMMMMMVVVVDRNCCVCDHRNPRADFTGWSIMIIHRKVMYTICCLRDVKLENRKISIKQHIKYFNFRS